MMSSLQRQIEEVLRQFAYVEVGILFGSVAANREAFYSDVDVAVAATRPLTTEEKMSLMDALALRTGRPVDLLDLSQASGTILHQSLTKGLVLVNRNPMLYARLILTMLYDQADMAPLRQRMARKRLEAFAHG
jgi:predicted nucleotidyltransferase